MPAGKGSNVAEERRANKVPSGKASNASEDRKAPSGKAPNASEDRKAPSGKAPEERRDSNVSSGKGSAATEERRGSNARRDSNSAKRETFRPPWVKEGPDGLPPKPSNLWSQTRRSSDASGDAPVGPKKPSTVKTSQNSQENGAAKEHTFVKPQLKPVPPKEQTKLQSKEVKVPIKLNSVKDRPELQKPPLNRTGTITQEDKDVEKAVPTERNAIVRQESLKKFNAPKAPPMPPPAPAMPRPKDMKPLTISQMSKLEQLKARPKVRPDWSGLLKDIETGQKLKHVNCNDRSKPLLPQTKVAETDKTHFVYESEKSEKGTSHNKLLKEIQQGVSLKKVKTNDRSKPVLEGLRKFRRQMTIEEQIIKSQSMASIPPEEIADEADELDDIDKVRDDLQSTKQMLALEMRNKEAMTRENKRLQTRLQQLESELDKERSNKKAAPAVETDEKLLTSLKSEAADARKTAEDLEKKFYDAAHQLDHTKNELEEVRKQKQQLEKKLLDSVQGGKRLSLSSKTNSFAQSESDAEEPESESDGEDTPEKREKKAQRELRQLRNKLRSYKTKEDNAKKERVALKTQIKRLQEAIKLDKKKYKNLQKEVTKMEALMKEVGDSDEELDEEEEEEEEKKPEPESESESETETESSESESESEKSVSESEDAPHDKKTANLGKRANKHEGRLSALKKGNYMLKTTVERLQDDLNIQKEKTATLQQDLDSVLAELG